MARRSSDWGCVIKPFNVGIVGSNGDLGKHLISILLRNKIKIVGYDISPEHTSDFIQVKSLEELALISDVIHWCAPLQPIINNLVCLSTVNKLVLHDSIMSSSDKFKKLLLSAGVKNVEIVHFLMNNNNKVVINSKNKSTELAKTFENYGLETVRMTTIEHDYLIAISQSMIAMLCVNLLPILEPTLEAGNLTPSGAALTEALQNRASNWTESTLDSILKNPELFTVLEMLLNKQKNIMKNNLS